MKGQMKIQEMAFVLLALILLAVIAFIFFIRLQAGNIERSADLAKQQTAISLLDKIAALPEISCAKGEICIDEDKALMVERAYSSRLENQFQGLKNVKIARIYPAGPDIVLYNTGSANQTYSTFVSLCQQQASDWKCGIALLEAGF